MHTLQRVFINTKFLQIDVQPNSENSGVWVQIDGRDVSMPTSNQQPKMVSICEHIKLEDIKQFAADLNAKIAQMEKERSNGS